MAIAAGGVSVWSLDVKTGDLRTDPVFPALLGIEVAASYPRDYGMKYIHPGGSGADAANRRRMLDPTAPRDEKGNVLLPEIEFRSRRSDGEIMWFLGRGTVVRGKVGNPTRAIGTCTDITARAPKLHCAKAKSGLRGPRHSPW